MRALRLPIAISSALIWSATVSVVGVIPAHAEEVVPPISSSAPPIVAIGDIARPNGVGAHVEEATLLDAIDEGKRIQSSAPRTVASGATVTVELLTEPNNHDRVRTSVIALGGSIVGDVPGVILVTIARSTLSSISNIRGALTVREPVDLRLGRTTLRPNRGGIDAIPYPPPDLSGNGATGVKVGIIDAFDSTSLQRAIQAGELAPIPAAQRGCWWLGATCQFGTPAAHHGVAVAEVLSDVAPNAKFYLAEAGTIIDYRRAIDWFAANGVRVVNHSGTGAFDGPGDGTGPSAAVVDYAVSKGMVWINAAGNGGADQRYASYRGGYWSGPWNDPDGDRWLNFYGSDEGLGTYCGALLGLRWSDWGTAKTDYDLFVSDLNASTGRTGTRIVLSNRSQAAGSQPLEGNDLRWLCNDDTAFGPVYDRDGDGYVALWVQRTTRTAHPTTGDRLEIMVNLGFLEHAASRGSAAVPFGDSRNAGAISVGSYEPSNQTPMPFSSQGPTTDGRIKPDLVTVSCLDTLAYGMTFGSCLDTGFDGTSASAPLIAGLAAATVSRFPSISPVGAHLYLRQLSPTFGRAHPTNTIGWGAPTQLLAPASPPVQAGHFVPRSPVRILDTRRQKTWTGTDRIGPLAPASVVRLSIPSPTSSDLAYVLNIVSLGQPRPGYVQVISAGLTAPGTTSNLNNDAPAQTVSNLVIVPVGAEAVDRAIDVYTSSGGHVVVDLLGVFRNNSNGDDGSGRFTATVSTEVMNTATCTGLTTCDGSKPLAGSEFIVDLTTDATSVPADAKAAMVVIAGTQASSGGFVSIVAPTAAQPYSTSTLNLSPSRSQSTTALVPIDTLGRIKIFTSTSAHLKLAIVGWFSGPHPTARPEAGLFVATAQNRLRDSRMPAGAAPATGGAIFQVPTAGLPGIVANRLGASMLNVTATRTTAAGSVRVVSDGTPRGDAAVLVSSANQTIAAMTMAPASKAVTAFVPEATTHLVVDSVGRFVAPTTPVNGELTLAALPEADTTLPHTIAASKDGSIVAIGGTGVVHFWDKSTQQSVAEPLPTSANLRELTADGRFGLYDAGFVDNGPPEGLFVYDRVNDTHERIGKDLSGAPAPVTAGTGHISDSGRYVTFVSGSALTPTDTDTAPDLYLVDRLNDTTTLIPDPPFSSSAYPAEGRIVPSGTHIVQAYVISTASGFELRVDRRALAGGTVQRATLPASHSGMQLQSVSLDGSSVIVAAIFDDPTRGARHAQVKIEPATGTFRVVRYSDYGSFASPMTLNDTATRGLYDAFGLNDPLVSFDGELTFVQSLTTGMSTPVSRDAAGVLTGPRLDTMSRDGRWHIGVVPSPGTNLGVTLFLRDLNITLGSAA